jgi:hypothetical protein
MVFITYLLFALVVPVVASPQPTAFTYLTGAFAVATCFLSAVHLAVLFFYKRRARGREVPVTQVPAAFFLAGILRAVRDLARTAKAFALKTVDGLVVPEEEEGDLEDLRAALRGPTRAGFKLDLEALREALTEEKKEEEEEEEERTTTAADLDEDSDGDTSLFS